MRGGFEAWQAAGYPVEPKPVPPRTIEEVAENLRQAEGDDADDVPV